MENKTIGILSSEQYIGGKNIGSTMIRVRWPLHYWPEAEEFLIGKKYDVVIFQKAYDLEFAKRFMGIKILDLCDAEDWLTTLRPIKEMISYCDAVTTATEAIAEFIRKLTYKPVVCIPDRVDLAAFPKQKEHKGDLKTAVWYGYSQNFPLLEQCVGSLIKNKINLIVVSNKPFIVGAEVTGHITVTNYPWSENWQDDILKGDIVLNPKQTGGRWGYKSNNKTLNAWALGMPVAESEDEMLRFIPDHARQVEAAERLRQLKAEYDVRKSVEQYRELINNFKK